MELTNAQISGINKALRQYELETGAQFATFLQDDVLDVLYGGSLGIEATAADVDSLAKGGGAFTWDAETDTLDFGYGAGRVHNGKTMVTVSAGTVTLTASSTNYVEVTRAGVVSANTTAFTSGRMPLYTVVTGLATISTVTVSKPLMTLIGPNGVDGSMLSTAGQTKEVNVTIGTIATAAGSTKFTAVVPSTVQAGSVLTGARFVSKDALAASDTNYVSIGVVNKGAGGVGTQAIADVTAAANTTKATGGTAIAAYTPRALTLATLTIGTERDVTGGHVLSITFTVTGTLANTLTECSLLLEFAFQN